MFKYLLSFIYAFLFYLFPSSSYSLTTEVSIDYSDKPINSLTYFDEMLKSQGSHLLRTQYLSGISSLIFGFSATSMGILEMVPYSARHKALTWMPAASSDNFHRIFGAVNVGLGAIFLLFGVVSLAYTPEIGEISQRGTKNSFLTYSHGNLDDKELDGDHHKYRAAFQYIRMRGILKDYGIWTMVLGSISSLWSLMHAGNIIAQSTILSLREDDPIHYSWMPLALIPASMTFLGILNIIHGYRLAYNESSGDINRNIISKKVSEKSSWYPLFSTSYHGDMVIGVGKLF